MAQSTVQKPMKEIVDKIGFGKKICIHTLRKVCSYYLSSLRGGYLKGNSGLFRISLGQLAARCELPRRRFGLRRV